MQALVIGGTRFIGPPTVEELLDAGYDVTLFNRGNRDNPFTDRDRVDHYQGDRTERAELAAARDAVDPDVVVDMVAYYPQEVREAVDLFAAVDSYVFVSSAAAYAVPHVPIIEERTPLEACTDEQASDDSMASYGPRKAECDRIVFEAADAGVNAVSVRPSVVYGPQDHTERLDYWIHRVLRYDQVLVPGDGDSLMHRVYVGDVARALRLAAEVGEPGEAYNCGDRRAVTLGRTVERIAEAAGVDVETVYACERELPAAVSADDFPLFSQFPVVLDTDKLAGLGWESTDLRTSMETTVAEHREADRDGREHGPDRDLEAATIDSVTG